MDEIMWPAFRNRRVTPEEAVADMKEYLVALRRGDALAALLRPHVDDPDFRRYVAAKLEEAPTTER